MKNTKKRIISFFMSLTLAMGILSFSMVGVGSAADNFIDFQVEGTGGVENGQSLWKNQVGMGGGSNKLGQAFGRSSTPSDIRIIIARVIKVFLELLGIYFLVIVVIAGYKYMSAQGDSKKTDEAIKSIQHATIGLLITLSAFALTSYILDTLIATQDKQGYYLFK